MATSCELARHDDGHRLDGAEVLADAVARHVRGDRTWWRRCRTRRRRRSRRPGRAGTGARCRLACSRRRTSRWALGAGIGDDGRAARAEGGLDAVAGARHLVDGREPRRQDERRELGDQGREVARAGHAPAICARPLAGSVQLGSAGAASPASLALLEEACVGRGGRGRGSASRSLASPHRPSRWQLSKLQTLRGAALVEEVLRLLGRAGEAARGARGRWRRIAPPGSTGGSEVRAVPVGAALGGIVIEQHAACGAGSRSTSVAAIAAHRRPFIGVHRALMAGSEGQLGPWEWARGRCAASPVLPRVGGTRRMREQGREQRGASDDERADREPVGDAE